MYHISNYSKNLGDIGSQQFVFCYNLFEMEINNKDESNNNATKSRDEEIKEIYDRMVESVNHSISREISISTSFSRERSIYMVPKLLRNGNPKAYSPQVISIGPLHYYRTQNDLTIKEKKGSYVLNFLTVAKLGWNEMINKFLCWEERARNYYVETIKMERDEFIQLLIYDSCFVVMYIIGSMVAEFRDLDTSFLWRFSNGIFKDLLLLENQLPFFLLHHLYNLCAFAQPSLKDISFIELLRGYFTEVREGMSYVNEGYLDIDANEVNHLVDFLRIHLTQPRHIPHFLDFSVDDFLSSWPLTATELHDCGISFHGQKRCMMNVNFRERNGVLKMPKIIIDDSFEILFRNMIAYEYCHLKSKDVSNFGMFMHFLINTNKDVSLLVDDGIIQNHLGSTREIVVLFNDLCKNIMVERNLYSIECRKMKEYCKHRRHRWMTSLKRDYFGTPWAFISFVAAVLLLLLTLLQTVVAFVALYK